MPRRELPKGSAGTWVAPRDPVPKKQHITLSPSRSGRRIRWTFEVSADVSGEDRARTKKAARKAKKRTPAASVPEAQAAAPVVETPQAIAPPSASAAAPAAQPAPVWQMTRPHMGVIAGAAVFVIALMAVPRQPASDTARPQHQPDAREETADISNASPSPAAPAPRATKVARPVVNKPALKEAPRKWPVRNVTNRTPERAKPPSPGAAAATNSLPAADASATKPAAPEPMPLPPSATPAASASQATITGCLEMSTDGKEFRLADTEGRDAPKSRSWRTGFLRKRTAPVALAGASDPLELRKSVGKRVSATGLLTDRELQVDSLRIVGSSCN